MPFSQKRRHKSKTYDAILYLKGGKDSFTNYFES